MADTKNNNPLGLPQPEVLVAAKSYRLEGCPENDEFVGKTYMTKGLIKLVEGQGLHQLKDTLLHELVHVIDYDRQLGLKEKQVHAIAGGLLDVLWTNPALAYWLCSRDVAISESKPKASKGGNPKGPKTTPMDTGSTKVKRGAKKPPVGFITKDDAVPESDQKKFTSDSSDVREPSPVPSPAK